MVRQNSATRQFLRDAVSAPAGRLANWGLLRTFYFIAEEGSITGAARRLSISQPSVSASLQRLEDHLGQQLIDRRGRRFALTGPGRLLFAETEQMFRAVERAEERLAARTSGLTGQVHIQTVTGNRSPLFDESLRLMHQRHPSVAFKVEVASSHAIMRNVADRIVPFGICLMVRPFAGLVCRLILRAEYGIVCGREHPLFGRSDVTLADLRHEGFIGFSCTEEGNAPEPLIVLRMGAGLGGNVTGTSSDFAEVVRMTVAGLGITILPLPAIEADIAAGQLWQFPIEDARLSADLYYISSPGAKLTAAEHRFCEVFDEVLSAAPSPRQAFLGNR